jgi:hypothetical protein
MDSRHSPWRRGVAAVVLAAAVAGGCGRGADEHGRVAPHFEPGFNLFSPEQDVELGRQSAQQVAAQIPMVGDAEVVGYVRDVGGRLAEHAPGERFPYEFHVANLGEVNAFALPGGIIFVTRGTLETVRDEGELAGVLAHEISHVALRHGTSQMSKAYIAQTGLGILREIFGGDGVGNLGDVVAAVGGAGLNTLFLKFGRTAETQSDLTGARIMADAGYDPIDMVEFFQQLEARGGPRTPEFLSDHPNPGNRARAVEQVREALDVRDDPIVTTDAFRRMKGELKQLPASRAAGSRQVGPAPGGGARPEPPAEEFESFSVPTGAYEVGFPANWDVLSDRADAAAFAPPGGYGKLGDNLVFTHGVMVGAIGAASGDLAEATRAFVGEQLAANPDFQVAEQARQVAVGGRPGLATVIAGPSPVTGQLEVDVVYTTFLPDGRLFYAITVAPHDEAGAYQPTFERVMASIRLG